MSDSGLSSQVKIYCEKKLYEVRPSKLAIHHTMAKLHRCQNIWSVMPVILHACLRYYVFPVASVNK